MSAYASGWAALPPGEGATVDVGAELGLRATW
jgi:hypothetical protein